MTKTYPKVYIFNIREKVNISVDNSKKKAVEIVKELVEHININCTALQVNYKNKTGFFSLICDFGKKTVDYDKLEKYIKQCSEKDWSQDYREWKNAD